MTLYPDVDRTKGFQNKCCRDNLDFFYDGDGVEWEMYQCSECKLKYVVPIEIQRFYEDATLVIDNYKKEN